MTKRTFFLFAAIVAIFAHDGAHAQTGVPPGQIKLPAGCQLVMGIPPSGNAGCVRYDPNTMMLDLTTTPPTLKVLPQQPTALPVFVDAEVPAGTIDGSNTAFTLASAPNPATSLAVYRNGIRQKLAVDYTLAGNTITFLAGSVPPGSVPQPGDLLLADYRH